MTENNTPQARANSKDEGEAPLELKLWSESEEYRTKLPLMRRFWRKLWRFRFLMTHDELAKNSEYEDVDRRVVRRLLTRGKLLDLALKIEGYRVNPNAALGLVLGLRRPEKRASKQEPKEGEKETPDGQSQNTRARSERASVSNLEEGSTSNTESDGVTARVEAHSSLDCSGAKGPADQQTAFGFGSTERDIFEAAVRYRIATTDLFVEKAQYYLERRALLYLIFALILFSMCLFVIGFGATMALRNTDHPPEWPIWLFGPAKDAEATTSELNATTFPGVKADEAQKSPQGSATDAQGRGEFIPPPSGTPAQTPGSFQGKLKQYSKASAAPPNPWIELLRSFIRSFTAYGFLVLFAVMATRAAKACMDQREQLLTRRHSLRQGRLFLHLNGGVASVEELKVAFDWNHSQPNAFSTFDPEAKAPWGNVIEEVVKIIPQVASATAQATIDRTKPGLRGSSRGE